MVRFLFICKSPEDAAVYQTRLERATRGNSGARIYRHCDIDNAVYGVCMDLYPTYDLADSETVEPIIKWLLPIDDPNY